MYQQGPKLLHSKPETPWQGGIKEISKINKILKKRLDAAKQKDTKENQPIEKPVVVMKMPQIIDNAHCLAVAKALLQLILAMDHSSSADMMLLCFKVSMQNSAFISRFRPKDSIQHSFLCEFYHS